MAPRLYLLRLLTLNQVDENMRRAHVRGAATSGKFFFRKNVFRRGSATSSTNGDTDRSRGGSDCGECRKCGEDAAKAAPTSGAASAATSPTTGLSRTPSSSSLSSANSGAPLPGPGAAALEEAKLGRKKETRLRNCFPVEPAPSEVERTARQRVPVEEEYDEMSMEEIMCGKGDFPGLLGLVRAYVDSLDVEAKIKVRLTKYLDFVERRANGESFCQSRDEKLS